MDRRGYRPDGQIGWLRGHRRRSRPGGGRQLRSLRGGPPLELRARPPARPPTGAPVVCVGWWMVALTETASPAAPLPQAPSKKQQMAAGLAAAFAAVALVMAPAANAADSRTDTKVRPPADAKQAGGGSAGRLAPCHLHARGRCCLPAVVRPATLFTPADRCLPLPSCPPPCHRAWCAAGAQARRENRVVGRNLAANVAATPRAPVPRLTTPPSLPPFNTPSSNPTAKICLKDSGKN